MVRVLMPALVLAAGLAGAALAQTTHFDVTVHRDNSAKGFEKLKVSKAAIGDTQIILWQNTAINPDCTAIPGVSLSVLKEPEHGKVNISEEPTYLAFPAGNPRSACNTRKVPAHRALYQAEAGFKGHDRVVLQGSSPEGRVREINVYIEVRPAG